MMCTKSSGVKQGTFPGTTDSEETDAEVVY